MAIASGAPPTPSAAPLLSRARRRIRTSLAGHVLPSQSSMAQVCRRRTPALVLARGPLGIKPLYIAEVARQRNPLFFFRLRSCWHQGSSLGRSIRTRLATICSTLRATTAHDDRRRSHARACDYRTLRARQAASSRRYWRVPPYQPRNESFIQAAERFAANLKKASACTAFADVPVGAFLSGGIDSTSIVALMRKHNRRSAYLYVPLPRISRGGRIRAGGFKPRNFSTAPTPRST